MDKSSLFKAEETKSAFYSWFYDEIKDENKIFFIFVFYTIW
jgi:hypothetical protein